MNNTNFSAVDPSGAKADTKPQHPARSFAYFRETPALRLLALALTLFLTSCNPQKPAPSEASPVAGVQAEAMTRRHQAALRRDRFALTPTTRPSIDLLELAEEEHDEAPQPESLAHRATTSPSAEMLARVAKTHTITINRDFADYYHDRAIITTGFHVHSYVPQEADGDIHIGGYSDDMVIAGVAEIVNGYEHQDLLNSIDAAKGKSLPVTGVWRLWCEHPAPDHQDVQDHPTPPPQPDSGTFYHVFEIHPVLKLGSTDLSQTFHPIDAQFKSAHDADECFQAYNNLTCTVSSTASTITIKTTQVGYNYPIFSLELEEALQPMSDGSVAALGKAFDDSGTQVGECRMIFVKGTAPFTVASQATVGQRLRVMGLVRMDLGVLETRADTGTHASANLPYEMLILGVYP